MTRIPEPQLDAWRAVVESYGAVTAAVEQALAADGLPPLSWYDTLYALYSSPERRLRMSELATRVARTRGGTTKIVDRLVAQGLVERRSCTEDRRVQYATLLPAGVQMMRRMWPVYSGEIARHFADELGEDEAETLRTALRRTRDSACRTASAEAEVAAA